jgi:hypothetical protein
MARELSNPEAEDLRRDRVAALGKVLERIDEELAREGAVTTCDEQR